VVYTLSLCVCVSQQSVIAGKTQLTEVDRSCYISNTVTADIDINSRLSKAGDACIWQTATSSLEWTQHTNDNRTDKWCRLRQSQERLVTIPLFSADTDRSKHSMFRPTPLANCVYTGRPQKLAQFLYALNVSTYLWNYFTVRKKKICNNTITKTSTTPQVCRYTFLWNVKCRKQRV